MHDMDEMMGMMGGGMVWMAVVLVVVLAAVATAIVLAVKHARRERPALAPQTAAEDEALRILRQRYARGEIDEDEFLHRQSALKPY